MEEKNDMPLANDPGIAYGTINRMPNPPIAKQFLKRQEEPLRVVSDEELAQCITLEELDRHLTELINNYYSQRR